MYFITGLPRIIMQHDEIMVVGDKLSEESHFIPIKSTFKAIDISNIFMKKFFRLHGLPKIVEFSYNNGYKESLRIIPFEDMYGKKCIFPISWDIPMDKIKHGLDLLKEMERKIIKIRKNLKVSHDRHKSYANNKKNHKEFNVGGHMYLRLKPKISSMRMGTCAMLATRYCGVFEVLERVGTVAYILTLPPTITTHNVFHVYLLNKYVHDSDHVVDWNVIHVEPEGELHPEPQCILERRETMLCN
jgi:hypothetical protein